MKTIKVRCSTNPTSSQNNNGLADYAKLGQLIIDKALQGERNGGKLPLLIADIKTLDYHAQLFYRINFGDIMDFTIVDVNDPDGGLHCYPTIFHGDTEAFFRQIVGELIYIDSLHSDNE